MDSSEKILENRKILLGISGGIAAYKSAELASMLTQSGAEVTTVMSESACKLICAKTFEALTSRPVLTTLWNSPEDYHISHINTTTEADMIVVAPATANIIGKMACGICDNILSTVLAAGWQRPVLFAPAMNSRMWENPAVQKNITTLKNDFGVHTIGPCEGYLACGTGGTGRMAEPEQIFNEICKISEEIKS